MTFQNKLLYLRRIQTKFVRKWVYNFPQIIISIFRVKRQIWLDDGCNTSKIINDASKFFMRPKCLLCGGVGILCESQHHQQYILLSRKILVGSMSGSLLINYISVYERKIKSKLFFPTTPVTLNFKISHVYATHMSWKKYELGPIF